MESAERSDLKYSGYRSIAEAVPDFEITQTSRGTPGGEYLRRFWQPVAYVREIEKAPLRTKIMGEELVVFKDKSGAVGVLYLHCQHRGTSLEFGRAEEHGIRCCYHGRVFDVDGSILEMPGEPKAALLMKEQSQPAYPAHIYGGVVFAYMGPIEKKPPFPLYDRYNVPGMRIQAGPRLPFKCNWVQVKENAMDPAHTAILHAFEGIFAEGFGKFPEITWQKTPNGMIYAAARRVGEMVWVRTTDIMMPNVSCITSVFEEGTELKERAAPWMTAWTVPEDDENTHQFFFCHVADDDDMPDAARFPALSFGQSPNRPYELRQRVPGDYDAMVSQGANAPHSLEHLGTLDRGVAMYRRLLREGVRDVKEGRDPHGLIRSDAPQSTYGSDLVVPAGTISGDTNDPKVLMAFAEETVKNYLASPPLAGARSVPKPPPFPNMAAAAE